MTTQQIRSEIEKALDKVPESALENVLLYIREQQKPKGLHKDQHLNKILSEDSEVLRKLAQ